MKNKPQDFSHVPEYYLYCVKVGKGSIMRSGSTWIMAVPDIHHKLSCGCNGSASFIIFDHLGNPCMTPISEATINSHYPIDEVLICPFQNKESESFWEQYYKKHPYHRPIVINH